MRSHVVGYLETMDSLAYSPLSRANPTEFFVSFHLDTDAMGYALSRAQLLLRPAVHLVQTRKQTMVESRISELL